MEIRRIYVILLIVAVFGLAGCGGQGPEATPTPTKTAVAVVAADVAPTMTPSPVAVVATATPAPQAVSREDEQSAIWDTVPHVHFAGPLTKESGGVVLEVERVRIYELAAGAAAIPELQQAMETTTVFEGAQLIGAITIKVTNNTDRKVNIYPDQGTVVVGSEQVNTEVFLSDNVGGEFFPGVVKDGAVVFLLSRTSWADVAGGVSLLYEVRGSNDAADFSRLGEDLLFEFALTP